MPQIPEIMPACSPFEPMLPARGTRLRWGQLYGNGDVLAIANAAKQHDGPVLVITPDTQTASHMQEELGFFNDNCSPRLFPDWETLPYDAFSPHQDIISERLETLYRLPGMDTGILLVPVSTLLQKLAPISYLQSFCLFMRIGENLDMNMLRQQLEQAGYNCVSQVMEHGEFAMRGSLLDLYPMGSALPYRVDLFDDEIESIRTFNPETQLSITQVDEIQLLPAREMPINDEGIKRFRQNWRQRFEGDPNKCSVYSDVSNGIASSGIEYYLPLFHEQTGTLFDYLPDNTLIIRLDGSNEAAELFEQDTANRYEDRRHDIERPILAPRELYTEATGIDGRLEPYAVIDLQRFAFPPELQDSTHINFTTGAPPTLSIQARAENPYLALENYINSHEGKILICSESTGRREHVLDVLRPLHQFPKTLKSWQDWLDCDEKLAICVSPLQQGIVVPEDKISVITETQIFGERAHRQSRRARRSSRREAESIVQSLTDLEIGSPVVHEEHGVGRYLGLEKIKTDMIDGEFLLLEYAGGDKLYVPVSSLQLISRFTGTSPENAPLHKLGSDQWEKARRKAAQKAHDVAAELLDIYSRRALKSGYSYEVNEAEYNTFASGFPFEETPDQQAAIESVYEDMHSDQPMDRVVCGDVGFGKTEVAMRAAFIAAQNNKQVVVLVPTTLLAQQHYNNFLDRFSDWPFRIEVMSRFKTARQQERNVQDLADGKIDIIIGTHKLIHKGIKYRNLGLVIIDEEHRFGVRQKEHLKSLRSEVDILTLTATPIPRTLNMSMSGLRDLSIIATPPGGRVAIKTFVSEWNTSLLQEAFAREIMRGGQVYFLHNEVSSIDKMADELQQLIPGAKIGVAHGQMRERELEQVMLDFYHQRFNVLVATTIIESGIDIPTANTIIINRADKLGLAQLHQLRGRVGRSHHRAYAYMLLPDRRSMTADAVKRLEAIESLEDLGSGFMLATHDLEIRGAGELLGDDQSGQIHEIGFTMYTELLERAVKALKSGQQPDLLKPLDHGPEVNLQINALLPDDYLPDIHTRLITYKKIASCCNRDELRDMQVEMIDRFGLLPQSAKNLIRITELKLLATPLGIRKIDANAANARILLGTDPHIDVGRLIRLIQEHSDTYKLEGQEKIRIFSDMSDEDSRFGMIEELLREISPVEAIDTTV